MGVWGVLGVWGFRVWGLGFRVWGALNSARPKIFRPECPEALGPFWLSRAWKWAPAPNYEKGNEQKMLLGALAPGPWRFRVLLTPILTALISPL